MIKRLFLCVLLLFAVGISPLSADAVLTLDKKVHNFGNVLKSKPVTCSFVITNDGDQPLVIHQVVPSCGCTATEYTKEPIAPGKTGIVKLTYDAKNQFEGKFSRMASIYSNAANKAVRVRIQGVVIDDTEK